MVGVGSLKYNDLKENRTSDIVFDWKRMLDFAGDSAPYIQYTHARLKSIIRKTGGRRLFATPQFSLLREPSEQALMRHVFEFPQEVKKSAETLYTNNLAKYLYDLSVLGNRFYESVPVAKEADMATRTARLGLLEVVTDVLRRGLALLGIEAPERV